MKLAILCASEAWGGLEINVLNLLRWMKDRGHQVLLITYPQARNAEEAKKHQIPSREFNYKGKHLNFRAAIRLKKILKEEAIQNLIIGHYTQFYLAVHCKQLMANELKLIYWQQMQTNVKKTDAYHSFFYRKLDAWISPLPYLAEQLKEQSRIRPEIIRLIPLCIEMERFQLARDKREEGRKLFALPESAFLVGTIGRIDPIKGQEFLIRALAELKANTDIHILLMGEETKNREETYLPYLKGLVQEFNLESRVHFRSFTDQTPLAFAALDAFVMASLSEPFGMVTIEALATRCPVIGSDSGGTRELLNYGEAGLLFPPKSVNGLKAALQKLYQDPAEKQQLAQKGEDWALQNYSYVRQCELVEELYQELLK